MPRTIIQHIHNRMQIFLQEPDKSVPEGMRSHALALQKSSRQRGFCGAERALFIQGFGEIPQQATGPRGRTGALLAKVIPNLKTAVSGLKISADTLIREFGKIFKNKSSHLQKS